jgi:LmbE family N-acetylglucosaminyl deacetylase
MRINLGRSSASARSLVSIAGVVAMLAAPSAAGAAIQSDEFNGSTLDTGVWSFVDPVGDSTLTVGGGHANISVPALSSHDIWTNGALAPRLSQEIDNTDFEVEVKLDTAVGEAYEMQGIVVEQDVDDLLRLEVHSDGGGTNLFAAAFAGGSATVHHYGSIPGGAPVYLRVVRSGNYWTIRYSHDGASWTTATTFMHAMTVTAIGPFIGNSGAAPPSFSGDIDYFREIRPDETPPELGTVTADPGTISAEVSWTTDEPATSAVAYGPDSSYGSATVESEDLVTSHSVTVHGLACGTTYHYEARSEDAAGNVGDSPDGTFTTEACPSGLVSDEFDDDEIDTGVWTLVDPVGDVDFGAGDGAAEIGLPSGVGHDIWTGANRAPRLLQAAPDEDFEVEVKFASAVTSQYQLQGLVVEQDADDLLRLEVHHDGAGARLFLASFEDGAPAIRHDSALPSGGSTHLRLMRVGDDWTLSYSPDGETWTRTVSFEQEMEVSTVGPFAGNSGAAPPALDAQVDYFRYIPPDETAPQIDDVTAAPGTGSTARVEWTTDEPTSSTVAFGTTNAYGDVLSAPGAVSEHAVVLHGLRCATTYHYEARSTDSSGNSAAAPDGTFVTAACPDEIESDEFGGTALDERWAAIDPVGDATFGVGGGTAGIGLPAGTGHDLWTGANRAPRLLQAAPDESFEVEAKFDTATSAQYQMQGFVVEESHDRLLRFETHFEGSTRKLFVAQLADGSADVIHHSTLSGPAPAYLRLRRAGDQWRLSHSVDGEAWTTATTFTRALDVTAVGPFAGNTGDSPPAFESRIDYFREITDRTPPDLSAIDERPRSRSAVVTWTSSEPAGSKVDYRTGGGAWTEVGSTKLGTRHYVVVSGLACATSYEYRVRSADGLGNEAVSTAQTFATDSCTTTGGPDLEVWNGDEQTFGAVGVPQTWVNVVGNVSDPDGVASLTAAVNGGDPQTVGIGPDGWRLERAGDFNAELNQAELVPGANTVRLRAVDGAGNATVREVTVDWQGLGAGPAAASDGPVLVLAAHPDDEALGMAGIIERAHAQGRRVMVAILTNGEGSSTDTAAGECGAPGTSEQRAAAYGLVRDGESRQAMDLLGLDWSADLDETELVYLGYTGMRVTDVAQADTPLTNDITGLHRTYAEDFDNDPATCNGDFRYLLNGQHSNLSAASLAGDLDALMDLVEPSDVYTHAGFDGHPDHSEIYRQMVAAVRRGGQPARVHTTIMHPEGDGGCMQLSAARWPNPALAGNDPFARFTPWLDFTAPFAAPCDPESTETRWGPFGAPNELVEVPASMQSALEAANLKWLAIAEHETQIDCTNPGEYHANCGYMRAFVKRHEFFWTYDYRPKRVWPTTYAADWTSDASIAEQAQILEGEWRYEGGGVRPLATGFDRALVLGDIGWTDYDVSAPVTIHSLDPSKPSVGVGLGVGWQGHTAWGVPRVGHPTGGLCLYGRPEAEPSPLRLAIGYSPGPVHDTTVATEALALTPGVQYVFRFRQQALEPGETRYSCKVWPAAADEPAAWTLTADVPHWPGTDSQRSGSAVLLAHEVDATFGDAAIAPADD